MGTILNHPFLSSQEVEARGYQLKALNTILDSSALLILPTGTGKTPIELMAIAERLYQFPKKKAMLIAPTNPLLAQHYEDCKKSLNIPSESITMINGSIHWKKREKIVENATLILATPQVIRNDVNRGTISLSNYCILILDEAHHSTGNHAMAQVADMYLEQATSGLLIGATASPGSTETAILNLTKRLDSHRIFSMQRTDALIKPYATELESNIITLDLPKKIEELAIPLKKWLEEMVERLQKTGVYLHKGVITTGGLNEAMKRASRLIDRKSQHGWISIKLIADSIRLLQLINLITTQGIVSARKYMKRTVNQFEKGEKKLARFVQKKEFIMLQKEIMNMKETHNKIEKVLQLVKEQIEIDSESRIIVFASLRDSARFISMVLNGLSNVNATPFIGQSSKEGDEGMSQKQQISTLNRFREGELNVLVATSVGEEGLDIPSADRVIFYEPVASEIRTIQRRGRTGRHREGYVFILVSKDTKDEGIRYAAAAKEARMYRILNRVKNQHKLSLKLNKPRDLLENFTVELNKKIISAKLFLELEEERLKEIPSENKKPINTQKNNENEKIMKSSKHNLSISQRLRPRGQTGLEQFETTNSEEE
jgi:Fanconi anemia group M protein